MTKKIDTENIFFVAFFALIAIGGGLYAVIGLAHAESYWNFDQNLSDHGTWGNDLTVMDPVFACSVQQVTACWPDAWLALTHVIYVITGHGYGHDFNGYTFFNAAPESDYDFLNIHHEYQVEFDTQGDQYCPGGNCTHQYLMSKARSDPQGNVYGFAVGIQGDAHLYVYHRSNTAIVMARSDSVVFDGTPHHIKITNDGSGTWDGIKIYVDGNLNKEAYSSSVSVQTFSGSDLNDETFVIGNYWYRTGQTLRTGWMDEVKLYDSIQTTPVINNIMITDDAGNPCMVRALPDGTIYCQH